MKSVPACTPTSFSQTLLAVSVVFTVAWTGLAKAQPPANVSTAAAPRTFSELVNPARSRAAGAGVFREAVSALADGTALPPLAFRPEDQMQAPVAAGTRHGGEAGHCPSSVKNGA